MYHILIAEDEELELNFLYDTIFSNFNSDFSISKADSGDAVMDSLQIHTPDIVLMDIHLGSANGLSLCEEILKENPNAKIIIITAYEQFAYAQKSIELGVCEYLLKPITAEKLCTSVQALYDMLLNEQEQLLQNAKLSGQYENMVDLFSSSFVGSVINNFLDHHSYNMLHHIGLSCQSMTVFAVDFAFPNITLSYTEMILIKKMIIDCLSSEKFDVPFLSDTLNSQYLTLITFQDAGSAESAISIARKIKSAVLSSLHLSVKIGISKSITDTERLNQAYKQACISLLIGSDSINAYSDYLGADHAQHQTVLQIDEFVSSAVKGQIDDILARVSSRLTAYTLQNQDNTSAAKTDSIKLWIDFAKELENQISTKSIGYENLFVHPVLSILQAKSISDLNHILNEHFSRITSIISSTVKENSNYTVKRAQKHIHTHYREALTLISISESLNVSPYYLSHLFKEELSMGVIEYINYIRIGEAKKLLSDTPLPVKEIAFQVGYSDANYFCRVFKKACKQTPTVFRSLNLNI